jgi:hypothetical protein
VVRVFVPLANTRWSVNYGCASIYSSLKIGMNSPNAIPAASPVSFDNVSSFDSPSEDDENVKSASTAARAKRNWCKEIINALISIKFLLVILFIIFACVPSGIIVAITIVDLNLQLNTQLAETASQAKNVSLSWIKPMVDQQFADATTLASIIQLKAINTSDFTRISKFMFADLENKPSFQYIYYGCICKQQNLNV